MKVILTIQITSDYHLKCSVNNQAEETYNPCICFNDNTIEICQENNTKTIHFVKEWIENPQEYINFCLKFCLHLLLQNINKR